MILLILLILNVTSPFYLVVKFKNIGNSDYLTAYEYEYTSADIDTYPPDIEGIAPYQRWILKQIGKNFFYIISDGSFCFIDAYFYPLSSYSSAICNEFTGSPSQMWIIDGKNTLLVNYANRLAINYNGILVTKDRADPNQQWIIEEA